jgi:hypothetical protein
MKIFRWAYFFILFFLGKYMDTFMRIMEFFLKHVNCYETLEHLFLGTWQHFFFKILTYFYNKNSRIFCVIIQDFFCCMWRYFCFCNDFFTYNDFFLKSYMTIFLIHANILWNVWLFIELFSNTWVMGYALGGPSPSSLAQETKSRRSSLGRLAQDPWRQLPWRVG